MLKCGIKAKILSLQSTVIQFIRTRYNNTYCLFIHDVANSAQHAAKLHTVHLFIMQLMQNNTYILYIAATLQSVLIKINHKPSYVV